MTAATLPLQDSNAKTYVKVKFIKGDAVDVAYLTVFKSNGNRWLAGSTPIWTSSVNLTTPGMSVFSMSLAHDHRGLVLEQKGGDNTSQVIMGTEWKESLRLDAMKQLTIAMSKGRHGFGKSILAAAAVGVLIAGVVLASASYVLRNQTPSPANASIQDPLAPATPAASAATSPSQNADDMLSSSRLAQMAVDAKGTNLPMAEALNQAGGIVIAPGVSGGKQIVIWADPLCAHCRAFEENIVKKLPADIGVTIVPVAFRTGSKPLVSYVSCGKTAEEVLARWNGLMQAQPAGDFSQQCLNGPMFADVNSVLFARSGLTQTPTIMSLSGENIYRGNLESFDEVIKWIAQ